MVDLNNKIEELLTEMVRRNIGRLEQAFEAGEEQSFEADNSFALLLCAHTLRDNHWQVADLSKKLDKAEAALREILNIARQSDPDSDMGKIVSIIHKAMDIRP